MRMCAAVWLFGRFASGRNIDVETLIFPDQREEALGRKLNQVLVVVSSVR